MYIATDHAFPMGHPPPGPQLNLDAPPQVTYETFRAEDPRLVHHLSMREISGPTSFVGTRSYAVQFYNCDDLELGAQVYTIENKRSQDVLDVVPYCERSGKLMIGMNERIRPALAARHLVAGSTEPEVRGLMWNLPGRYLPFSSRPQEVESAVHSFLRTGLGLSQRGVGRQLGGSYFPSCGASPELCVMFAVPVNPLETDSQVAYHESFEASRRVHFVEAQSIIDQYLAGNLHDLRMVLAVFRLSKELGVKLEAKLPLTADSKNLNLSANHIPVLNSREVCDLISSAPSDKSVVARIAVHEVPNTGSQFIQVKRFTVTNHDSRGKMLGTYEAEVALRRGIDAVDVGCYTWIDGQLCMLVKRGVRPVIAIRALDEHPFSTDPSPLGIEGIAESLEGETSLEAIAERAKQGIREEAGLEPSHQPTYVGYTYPSPGANLERAYSYLSEVIPNSPSTAQHTLDEIVDLFYLPVDTLIELADRGIIRDPRLELSAHVVKAAMEGR